MLENTHSAKRRDRENFVGVTTPPMMDNSRITKFKVKVSMFGQMEEDTKVSGSTIKCMEKENSNGLMVKSTQVLRFAIKGDYVEDKKEGYGVF